jgi:hypothetical protein
MAPPFLGQALWEREWSWVLAGQQHSHNCASSRLHIPVAHGSDFGRKPEWGPKFRRGSLDFGRDFFNLKATQLKLPQYRLLFGVRRLKLGLLRSVGPFKSGDVWKSVSEKLAEQRNLNQNIPGEKTLESGTEQKLWRKFLQNFPKEKSILRKFKLSCLWVEEKTTKIETALPELWASFRVPTSDRNRNPNLQPS